MLGGELFQRIQEKQAFNERGIFLIQNLLIHYTRGSQTMDYSRFLMYFGVLNLDSRNQIWKFKYRYFAKFSDFEFNKYHIFWTLDFYQIKNWTFAEKFGNHCSIGSKNIFYK